MPTPDLFGIGVSGLQGSQLGLATTSHNIANVNSAGYSRQAIDFEGRFPAQFGGRFFGTGVEAGGVTRLYNQTIVYELRANSATFNSFDTYLNQAQRLDNIVADNSTGMNAAIQSYFNAVHGVSEAPASIPARQVMLSQTDLVASRFRSLYDTFDRQRKDVNSNLSVAADQVTSLGKSIAELNGKIAAITSSGTGGQPNDLLDERDRQIDQLSTLTTISVLPQGDGQISVFLGTGQSLVVSSTANTVSARASTSDPSVYDIFISSGAGSSVDVTAQMSGGTIGGLLQFRHDLLDPSMATLGRVAIGLAQNMNAQNALGMDLNNQLGGLIFTDMNSAALAGQRVTSDSANTGNASIGVTFDNPSLLNDSAYDLKLTAGTYNLVRLSDNATVASFAAPVAPATVAIASEGFSLQFTAGAAINGDKFRVNPTRDAAGNLQRVVDDVREFAAASPVAFSSVTSNTGTAVIKGVSVVDTTAAGFANANTLAQLNPPMRIVFTTPTTYNVLNATTNAVLASGTFTPNQDNKMLAQAIPALDVTNGFDVTLAGVPSLGDTFNITYNAGGFGDNRNMQAFAALQTTNTLDNGRSTFSAAYGRLISDVGVRTHEADVSQKSSQTILRQNEARRESVSGVNLDEEAANLIKFQQAYEASAQVISVANNLFDVLFQSVR